MKPRLCRVDGLWACISPGCFALGYDPQHAFDGWWAMKRSEWINTEAAVSAETT